MINKEIALAELEKTIKFKLRHKNYERSCKLAEFNKAIVTGEGQDEMISNIKERETVAQKKSRVRVTNTMTRFATGQIRSFVKRLRRVDNVVSKVKGTEKIDLLNQKIERFHGESSLTERLFDLYEHYIFSDACAFVVVDRHNVIENGSVVDVVPYLVEVSSEEAINYKKFKGEYEWLIVEQIHEEEKINPNTIRLEKRKISHFYFYTQGYAIVLKEYVKEKPELQAGEEYHTIQVSKATKRTFVKKVVDMGSSINPIISLGVYTDSLRGTECHVSILDDAREVFLDLINQKSEFDLTKYLHTFLQKIVAAPECEDVHPTHGACERGCYGGIEKHVCNSCHGTGLDVHTTTQDVILVQMPDTKDQWIPLKELAAYIDMPAWLPPFQAEQLEIILKRVSLAIFNTEVFQSPIANKTATEVVFEDDKVNVKFLPYATAYSNAYKKIVTLMADYIGANLESVEHGFSSDFDLSNLTERISRYKLAKDSGLSYLALRSFETSILAKQHHGNPELVADIEAFMYHKPFADKSEVQIAMITASRSPDDFHRLLWENFDAIMHSVLDELKSKEIRFANLTLPNQIKKIREKTEELAKTIKLSRQPEPLNLDPVLN